MNFPRRKTPARILKDTHQHNCREEVLNAVLGHQGNHDNSQRPGGTRGHAATATNRCRYEANNKRCIEADERVNTGDKGKGNRFRNQSERDGKAREHFNFDTVRRKGRQFGIVSIYRRKTGGEGSKY